MTKKREKKTEPPAGKKAPYRTPQLKTHGDLRVLTQGKGGDRTDGAGEPKTRMGGAPG